MSSKPPELFPTTLAKFPLRCRAISMITCGGLAFTYSYYTKHKLYGKTHTHIPGSLHVAPTLVATTLAAVSPYTTLFCVAFSIPVSIMMCMREYQEWKEHALEQTRKKTL